MRAPPWREGAPLPSDSRTSRAQFRAGRGPKWTGWAMLGPFLGMTLLPAVAVSGVLATGWLGPLGWADAVVFVVAFVTGASLQYAVHRWLLHVPRRGLERFYELHTLGHHVFFADGDNLMDDVDDVDMVIMPLDATFGLNWVIAPVLSVPFFLLSWTAGAVFLISAWLYYVAFDLTHLAAHAPPSWSLDRIPGYTWFLWHHRRHHANDVMDRGNFSVILPLWDVVLGSLFRGSER